AKTPGALRAVELTDLALDALDILPTPLRREQLVFPGRRAAVLDIHAWSRRGKRPGPWTQALEDAELAYREPRQMRHTFATLALVDGASIEWISKQMGHEDIATTLRHYHKWLPSDKRNITTLNAAHAARTGLKAASAAEGSR
ncbi:MAG: site-specific integrase, partial [Gaiellaceae bacterium]